MFEETDMTDFIEIDEEDFRAIDFDNDEEREMQRKVIEEIDSYILGGIKYTLIFHEPSAKLFVYPVERTLH